MNLGSEFQMRRIVFTLALLLGLSTAATADTKWIDADLTVGINESQPTIPDNSSAWEYGAVNGDKRQVLVRYDRDDLLADVPAGSTINSAQLAIDWTTSIPAGNMYLLNHSFSTSTQWNNAGAGGNNGISSTERGSSVGTTITQQGGSGGQNRGNTTLTNHIQGLLDGTVTHRGFVLDSSNARGFINRIRLRVDFDPPVGNVKPLWQLTGPGLNAETEDAEYKILLFYPIGHAQQGQAFPADVEIKFNLNVSFTDSEIPGNMIKANAADFETGELTKVITVAVGQTQGTVDITPKKADGGEKQEVAMVVAAPQNSSQVSDDSGDKRLIRLLGSGDSNRDQEFNSNDLIKVFQIGKYETGQAATWDDGDWNGDGVFDSGDLVDAFQAGWYEEGPAVLLQDWNDLQ